MDNDQYSLSEKIVTEIDAVFQKDPNLSSFEIIPLPSNKNKNKSPVVHVINCLGLESWCVEHVYSHCHQQIFTNRTDSIRYASAAQSIVKYLNVAILINPDVTTFWNVRRQLFEKNRLDITKEFQYSAIVLSKKPKSGEAFAYRKWLYSFQSCESIDWTIEIALCEKFAEKSLGNYHAWCHRQWVLQKSPYHLRFEPRLTEKFIRRHIGDYSGFYHRQFIIKMLYEMEYHESENVHLTALSKLIHQCTAVQLTQQHDIIEMIMPNVNQSEVRDQKLKSLLYCLNLAAHDIGFCAELKDMFGYREGFEYHRKAIVALIVELCTIGITKLYQQPLTKMPKVDVENRFLDGLKTMEGKYGDAHTKWCQIFLGYD